MNWNCKLKSGKIWKYKTAAPIDEHFSFVYSFTLFNSSFRFTFLSLNHVLFWVENRCQTFDVYFLICFLFTSSWPWFDPLVPFNPMLIIIIFYYFNYKKSFIFPLIWGAPGRYFQHFRAQNACGADVTLSVSTNKPVYRLHALDGRQHACPFILHSRLFPAELWWRFTL